MAIERIKSFTVDHDLLEPGIYISRIDGDVTTFDLRTRKPNDGRYMDNTTMHSVEHMMATYLRNGLIGQDVLYFGPMGCQTGFYLLVKDRDPSEVYMAVKGALKKTIDHTGPVFGASKKECGNFENLSLDKARRECENYLRRLEENEPPTFEYRSGEDVP